MLVKPSPRIFLLSPAMLSGLRASLLVSPRARFELAHRLQASDGVTIGEIMSFLSGLYFRGKLAYARAFARPPAHVPAEVGALVITPHAGLRPVDEPITVTSMRAASRVDIQADNPRYRRPLLETARLVADAVGDDCEVVLLGSVATPKYVEPLSLTFGRRLAFPIEFVGRGDMSRGGLMLRCAASGQELTYVPIGADTPRHGPRPPRLTPLPRAAPAPSGKTTSP